MRVGIAFSSKDRAEKTKRTLKPLLQPKKFDTWWFDGSQTPEGQSYFEKTSSKAHSGIRLTGGSCRYIVCALTCLLEQGRDENCPYDYIGLVENDVMLHDDWFDRTIALFDVGKKAGLEVGAVSARTYVDRILIQCDGFAVMHNLGAGMVIFSRHAAELILQYYRTGMTTENRKVFSLLSGVDIGPYWAFKGSDHMLVADWQWDRMLAQHGLCSLALTPTKATQLEDIKAQGLMLAKKPVKQLENKKAFVRYCGNLHGIRKGYVKMPMTPGMRMFHGDQWTIFPHQIPTLGGSYSGDWRFKWAIGWGCFAWKAGTGESGEALGEPIKMLNPPIVEIPVQGSLAILVSGGEKGGKIRVEDEESGFSADPELIPEGEGNVLSMFVPSAVSYRTVRLTALTPGIVFYGIQCKDPQPYYPHIKFDFKSLPPL